MEIPVPSHSVVYIAHDDRLDRPDWLTKQFVPTEMRLVIGDKPMKVYRRNVATEKSFTLGSNTEHSPAGECNMYLVFVNAASD
jgi:beta-galactosidase